MKFKRGKLYQYNSDLYYVVGSKAGTTFNVNYVGLAVKDYKLKIIMSNWGYRKVGSILDYNKYQIKEDIKSGKLIKLD